jgi:outer membrane immunogenic protein
MSKAIFVSAFVIFAPTCSAVFAADYASYPAQTNSYRWQGPYVGVNAGYQWSRLSNSSADPSGIAGGVQAGANVQFGQFVFGGETDLQLSNANDTFAPWKFSNPWFGTLRARAGLAVNSLMFYGTAGLAYGSLKLQSTLTNASEWHTRTGWAVGAGAEIALTGNWSARAEYLYVDIGGTLFMFDGLHHRVQSNILRVGVNYRF